MLKNVLELNRDDDCTVNILKVTELFTFKWLMLILCCMNFTSIKKNTLGASLVVQWLRLCAPSTGVWGSIPSQVTRSHRPQLKVLHAETKTPCSQINKYLKKYITCIHTHTHTHRHTLSGGWEPSAQSWDPAWELSPGITPREGSPFCAENHVGLPS